MDESNRQIILLALAELSIHRPGWDYVLREIAGKQGSDGEVMYEQFKVTSADRNEELAFLRRLYQDDERLRKFTASVLKGTDHDYTPLPPNFT